MQTESIRADILALENYDKAFNCVSSAVIAQYENSTKSLSMVTYLNKNSDIDETFPNGVVYFKVFFKGEKVFSSLYLEQAISKYNSIDISKSIEDYR